jgi:hypothetical protein
VPVSNSAGDMKIVVSYQTSLPHVMGRQPGNEIIIRIGVFEYQCVSVRSMLHVHVWFGCLDWRSLMG